MFEPRSPCVGLYTLVKTDYAEMGSLWNLKMFSMGFGIQIRVRVRQCKWAITKMKPGIAAGFHHGVKRCRLARELWMTELTSGWMELVPGEILQLFIFILVSDRSYSSTFMKNVLQFGPRIISLNLSFLSFWRPRKHTWASAAL